MGKKEFENFLNREESKEVSSVDWETEKKKWLVQIDNLYKNVNEWLNEYTQSGKIKLTSKNISIYEEALGNYATKELLIRIGNKTAHLTPIGTILIGARGRIDLAGPVKTVRFILADKDAKGAKIEFREYTLKEQKDEDNSKNNKQTNDILNLVWKISTNPPSIKYTDLNQDSFLECLMDAING